MLRYLLRPSDRTYFERPESMSPILHRLLMQRGVTTLEEAESFLHPGVNQLNDPFLLSDMDLAVDRIREAQRRNRRVCIYGDYDVDGVCASAILKLYFDEIGLDADVYLPSRHDEGYGLNEAAVREIAGNYDLLLTVDCGVASRDLIALAKELGLDCVVTDHHRPGDTLPDCPLVNPLLKNYPCPVICGAGVAFKLVHALGGLDAALEYVDLAALATVADVVALRDENRAIVKLGLDRINQSPRPGIKALMDSAHLEKGQVNSEAIGFRIAPRLNAGGRLGSARRSLEILLEEDPFLAIARADELEMENQRRQSVEKEIRRQALDQLKDFDFCAHRIIMVRGENWNSGVIGLAASHLREQFHYPVIVFSEENGMLTGSCRSIEGVDIYKTLCAGGHLMEKFGGHAQAAGLTLKAENFDSLQTALDNYLFLNIDSETYVPFAEYDIPARLDECDERFVRDLSALEPTGAGNPKPIMRSQVQLMESRAIGADGSHLRVIAAADGVRRAGIFFGAGHMAKAQYESADILFTPQLNTWNGRTDVQLMLSALRSGDVFQQIQAGKACEDAIQRKFLTELIYNRGYNSLSAEPISLREMRGRMGQQLQGTMILCASLDSAREILEGVDPSTPDLLIGHMNDDPRLYNALCVCPEEFAFPPRLRTLVLGDVPVPANVPDDVQVYSLENIDSGIWQSLPDVDQMREVYKAALRLDKHPLRVRDEDELNYILSKEADLPPLTTHASLLALMDMQLLSVRTKPCGLIILPKRKTNPDDYPVWQRIQTLKHHR